MRTIDYKIIELSKKKIFFIIMGSCVFVALGLWLFSLDAAMIQSQRRFNNPFFIHFLGLVTIVFAGLCGIYGIIRFFDKKPGLVFNRLGIIDHSSGVSAGLVPWGAVIGAEVFEKHKQKMLIIKVTNPEKYINRGWWLKRTANKANHKMCGSPIAIASNALKINFSELLSLFEQYQQKYGNT